MDSFNKPLECLRCIKSKYKEDLCQAHYEHFLNKYGEVYFKNPSKYHKDSIESKKIRKESIKSSSPFPESSLNKTNPSECIFCSEPRYKDFLCIFHYKRKKGLTCSICFSDVYENGLCYECYNKGSK